MTRLAVADAEWPEVLLTERTRLRRVRVEDAPAVFGSYAADERVTRFLTWAPNKTVDDVRDFLTRLMEDISRGKQFAWAIQSRGDRQLIGMVNARVQAHMVELAYVLAYDWWGQGLMSEAVAAVVEAAQRNPQVFRIWGYHDVGNPASGRVMQKAGLEHEGRLRRWALHPNVSRTPRDVEVYCWVR